MSAFCEVKPEVRPPPPRFGSPSTGAALTGDCTLKVARLPSKSIPASSRKNDASGSRRTARVVYSKVSASTESGSEPVVPRN
jgi:hypothetical protein